MPVINSVRALNLFLESNYSSNDTIGFVPTMGALHQGHLSLIKQSTSENKVTVVSIFVNPTQFNNTDDLKKYPRTLEADVHKIEGLSRQIIVFAPTVTEMYGQTTSVETYHFDGLEHQMEGKFRPGHFDGVGTIVYKLFKMVNPTRAYFGEKDFQQLRIVQTLTKNYNLPVQIVPCSIYRENNGLAMSSRNERLPMQIRNEAGFIFELLQNVKKLFIASNFETISDLVVKTFENHAAFELEYFEICDEFSLQPMTKFDSTQKYRAFIALHVHNVRLIDNISLN